MVCQVEKADPEIVEAVRRYGDHLRNMSQEEAEEMEKQRLYIGRAVINALHRIEVGQAEAIAQDRTLYR